MLKLGSRSIPVAILSVTNSCATEFPVVLYRLLLFGIILLLAGTVYFGSCPASRADTLDQIRQRGTLRWGGDESGGAPYIIKDEDGKLSGFEAELAEYLAAKLGVKAEFVQKTWDVLPNELKIESIDIILNGYELSDERLKVMEATVPYYIYRLQLLARRNNAAIRSWDDLRPQPGQRLKTVGVLGGSAAHNFLEEHYGKKNIEIVAPAEEGSTGVMGQVARGQLDATVQDLPAAEYYAGPGREFPELKYVGDPIQPGYYVIFVRKGDDRLREQLDQAIRDAWADGTLRRIYMKYGLWNVDQENLFTDIEVKGTDSSHDLVYYMGLLVQAAWITVQLAFISMPLAMLIGLLIAVGRMYGPPWLGAPLACYVEFIRGTPLVLQLFVIYFVAMPALGLSTLGAFWAGVAALAINYSAYEAENYRAGLLAIPSGQMEAAMALGMSTGTALRRVIVPQAVRIVIPPVTNDFIALFKDTAVCSVIAVTELAWQYRNLQINNPEDLAKLGLMAAVLYLLMSYPLSLLARRLEKRLPRLAV